MSEEQKQPQAIDIGKLFVIIDEQKILGVEVEFNGNLTGANTAASVLSQLNNSLHNADWITKSVMRVANRDAQAQSTADQGGDNDSEDAVVVGDEADAS